MRNYKIVIAEKLLKFVQLQLFISLVSLPLIGAWGLPISTLGLIGNLVFTPWVILFVAVSTIIFFTELFHIPNEYLLYGLEHITQAWYYCLSWGKKSWVIGIPSNMLPFAYVFAISALLIMCHKRWGQLLESTALLTMLYLGFFGFWYYITPVCAFTSLHKGKGALILVSEKGRVIVYDNDYLRRIQSCESWVEYTLIPLLTYNTGTISIDIIWLNSFSPKAIQALVNIMEYAQVRLIKIPYFSDQLTSQEWRQFFKLYEKAQKEGTYIERTQLHKLS